LANPKFVDKAPAAIVAQEQARVMDMQAALQQLSRQREHIKALV
jgi:valyl-tRNA synthetase